uniref:SWIM-type domain-containing protein n=1 Tax=Nothobranchius rachovii TaxID=451742 RepID=A0A1A8PLE3_9TELE
MEETAEESPHCMSLDSVSKQRYTDLTNKYVGRDPYLMKMSEFTPELTALPRIESVDITNYLVLQTSFYTKQQMKKSGLEAYNFFVSGWVHNLGTKRLRDDYRLVFAMVNHSQRSSETPLKTWIISKEDGEVIAAHCNCMAGLSESCSHVGAVLFSIEAG